MWGSYYDYGYVQPGQSGRDLNDWFAATHSPQAQQAKTTSDSTEGANSTGTTGFTLTGTIISVDGAAFGSGISRRPGSGFTVPRGSFQGQCGEPRWEAGRGCRERLAIRRDGAILSG